jgi:hypothetical protein
MDTRESVFPITNEAPNEDEACLVSAIEESITLVTETLHKGSILPTDPLIHNKATHETKIMIDQDSHDATPTAAEVP